MGTCVCVGVCVCVLFIKFLIFLFCVSSLFLFSCSCAIFRILAGHYSGPALLIGDRHARSEISGWRMHHHQCLGADFVLVAGAPCAGTCRVMVFVMDGTLARPAILFIYTVSLFCPSVTCLLFYCNVGGM